MLNAPEYNRLRARLTIDPTRLDDDLIQMPMDQMSAAECTSEAANMRDNAKDELERVVSDLARQLREADDKISEKRIDSETPMFDVVIEAKTALRAAEFDYNLWRGLSDSLRTKSSSIDTISDLIKAGYMTPATIYKDRQEMIHQHREAQRAQYPAVPGTGAAQGHVSPQSYASRTHNRPV